MSVNARARCASSCRRPHTTTLERRRFTTGVVGAVCKMKRCAGIAPSITVASSTAPMLLVFGTTMNTTPVSSRIPVIPQPLAESNRLEELDHDGRSHQLQRGGREERQCEHHLHDPQDEIERLSGTGV